MAIKLSMHPWHKAVDPNCCLLKFQSMIALSIYRCIFCWYPLVLIPVVCRVTHWPTLWKMQCPASDFYMELPCKYQKVGIVFFTRWTNGLPSVYWVWSPILCPDCHGPLSNLPLSLALSKLSGWIDLRLTNLTLNALRQRQNGRHFTDDTFNHIFVNENVRISIKFSLKFVPKGSINKIPALVQIMACHLDGAKPLSEPVMVSPLTHINASLGLNELKVVAISSDHIMSWFDEHQLFKYI